MRILTFIVLLFCASFVCLAQTDIKMVAKSSNDLCSLDPEMPSYPGGTEKLKAFINQHFQDSVIQRGTTGRVFVNMVVDTSGLIKNVTILHGINDAVDNEVLRVFSIMPKWIPAEKNGVKIEKAFVFPIKIDFTTLRK